MSTPEAELLKVAPNAGLEELKKAFRKAALAHHPDHNPHPEASRHFRRVTEAYRTLEAQALLRQPPRLPREIPLADRVAFLVADVKALVKRWPAQRWQLMVDGLPAGVWVVSALDVVARQWPGAPVPRTFPPTGEGISQALEQWSQRMVEFPLPPLPKGRAKPLAEAVRAAEVRLRALDRPPRGS